MVVEVGLTVAEPFVPNTPKPEISTEVAFVALQLKTLDAPLAMVAGCAVRVTEGCGDPAATVMTIEDVTDPPGPVAVARKVVALGGATWGYPKPQMFRARRSSPTWRWSTASSEQMRIRC